MHSTIKALAGCRRVTSTECGEKSIASNLALRNAGKPKNYGNPGTAQFANDRVEALKRSKVGSAGKSTDYGNLGTAQIPNDRVEALNKRKVRSVICSFIVVLVLLVCLVSYEGGEEDYQLSMESKITLKDVKGVDQLKVDLEKIVHYLRASEQWSRLPKGVLLVGPTGIGKSMLARAVAGEAGVPFFMTRVSEFDEWSMRLGVRRVRKLFNAAKKRSPCVIFIDGLDAVGRHRRPTESSITWSTLNQLLVELDGLNQDDGIIVFGATNYAKLLDKDLVSPGHFDYRLYVPFPDTEGRKEILKSHLSKVLAADDVNVTTIARGTSLFTGAELADLVNIAAVRAAVDGAKDVSMAHLENAKDRIKRGSVAWNNYISKKQLRYEKKLRY